MDDQAGMATVGTTTSTRLRTLVDLSRAVRTAMVDERRLADQLAGAVAGQVGDSAIVWIQQAEGEPDCLGAVHRDPRVEELLRGSCLTGAGAADGLVAA